MHVDGVTMKQMLLPLLLCALVPHAHAQSAPPPNCAHPMAGDAAEVRAKLARRAAEIFERARASGWQSDPRLRALVDPSAEFTLVTGDVVHSASGVAGARAFAEEIDADSYRYPLPRGYADGPLNACGQSLRLELVDSANRRRLEANFVFRDDVLILVTAELEGFAEVRLKPRG